MRVLRVGDLQGLLEQLADLRGVAGELGGGSEPVGLGGDFPGLLDQALQASEGVGNGGGGVLDLADVVLILRVGSGLGLEVQDLVHDGRVVLGPSDLEAGGGLALQRALLALQLPDLVKKIARKSGGGYAHKFGLG